MEGCNYLRYNYDRKYRDESDKLSKPAELKFSEYPITAQLVVANVVPIAVLSFPFWAIPAAVYKVCSEVKKGSEARKAREAGFQTDYKEVKATKKRFIFPEEHYGGYWGTRVEFFEMFNNHEDLVNGYVAWRASQSCNDHEEHPAVKEQSQKVLDSYLERRLESVA